MDKRENTEFLINGYTFLQREPHMKLGTDSVLLSAFLHPSKAMRICDLGCGGGALSILLAARYDKAFIDGVDIQETAIELFNENIARNGLEERVSAVPADIRALDGVLRAGAYTAVVCNPPYFKEGAGKTPKLQEKITARSETEVEIADICLVASWLLQTGGEFALVYRAERLAELVVALHKAKIELKRLQYIQYRVGSEPKLLLAAGRKGASPGVKTLPPLIIKNENGKFSDEYLAAYGKKED